jgi:hypothetical protein
MYCLILFPIYLQYLSIYLSVSPSVRLPACLPTCLSLSLSVCLSVCLSICLPTIYLSIYLPIYLWLYSPLLNVRRFFSFLILYTVGGIPWTGNQPVARPLPTHRTTQTQNKRTQRSMPWAGFETTIPLFKRAKAVHALDRMATVIGSRATDHPNSSSKSKL